MNKESIKYNMGKDKVPRISRGQRYLTRVFDIPFISNFLAGPLKKVFQIDPSNTITKGFHCETPFLQVGKFNGLSNLHIHYSGVVQIGNYCSISSDVLFITSSHDLKNFNIVKVRPIIVEDYIWISTGATILQGVNIGRGAVIGANSVVRSDIPPYAIVTGNPCKIVKFRYTPEEAVEFEKEHYDVEDRTPFEILQENYQKFYLDRLEEIEKFTGL